MLAELLRELADRRRLAGAVHADDEDHRRLVREVERRRLAEERRDLLGERRVRARSGPGAPRAGARARPSRARRRRAVDQRLLEPLPRRVVVRVERRDRDLLGERAARLARATRAGVRRSPPRLLASRTPASASPRSCAQLRAIGEPDVDPHGHGCRRASARTRKLASATVLATAHAPRSCRAGSPASRACGARARCTSRARRAARGRARRSSLRAGTRASTRSACPGPSPDGSGSTSSHDSPGYSEIQVGVLARADQAAQLLAPPAEDPGVDPVRLAAGRPSHSTKSRSFTRVCAASSSRGRRRETICETPSPPIVTP